MHANSAISMASANGTQRTPQPARRMSALKGKAEVSLGRFDFRVWTRNGPRAAVAEVQKSRIMHRTVTNSFARGEELNQQLHAGYDTREDPDVEIFALWR